jgi:hypothetical protein
MSSGQWAKAIVEHLPANPYPYRPFEQLSPTFHSGLPFLTLRSLRYASDTMALTRKQSPYPRTFLHLNSWMGFIFFCDTSTRIPHSEHFMITLFMGHPIKRHCRMLKLNLRADPNALVPQSSEAPIAVGCFPSGPFNMVRVRDGVCTGRASIPGVHHCGCSFDDHFS